MGILPTWINHHAVESIGWALVHSVWQIAALAVLFAAVRACLRDYSAAVRYGWACVILLAMAAAPLATGWALWLHRPSPSLAAVSVPATDPETVPTEAAVAVSDEPSPAAESPGPATPITVAPLADKPVAVEPATMPAPVPQPAQRSLLDAASDWLAWVVAAWLLGVAGFSARLSCGYLGTWRLRRGTSEPVAAPWPEVLERLAGQLGVRRAVRLVQSALVEVPTVVGHVRPAILLPAAMLTGLTPRQLEAVLAHELAHIRRHDYLVNLVQTAIETVLFYHPAMWWVSWQIRQEREHCCDDLALAISGDRIGYARALARIAELRSGDYQPAVAASGGSLLTRIRRIVGHPTEGPGRRHAWLAGMLLLGTIFATTIGVMGATSSGTAKRDKSDDLPGTGPSRIEVVFWQAIVDEATVKRLTRGEKPGKNALAKGLEVDSSNLLQTLRQAEETGSPVLSDGAIHWAFDAAARMDTGWWIEHWQPYTFSDSGYRNRPDGTGRCVFDITVSGTYRLGAGKDDDGAQLTLKEFAVWEELWFYSAEGKRTSEAKSAKQPHHWNWSGTLTSSKSRVFFSPIPGNTPRPYYGLFVAQAVSVPESVVDYLRVPQSTQSWITDGVDAKVTQILAAKRWKAEQIAAGRDQNTAAGTYTTPTGASFEIAGIGRPTRWPYCWWNASAEAVDSPIDWQGKAADAVMAVWVRCKHHTGSISVDLRLSDYPDWDKKRQGRGSSWESKPEDRLILRELEEPIVADYLDDGGRIDVAIKFGQGEWTPIAQIEEGQTIEVDGGHFHLRKAPVHSDGKTWIRGGYDYDPAFEVGLVAVDAAGKRTPVASLNGHGLFRDRKDRSWHGLLDIDKSDVDHFLIVKRPVVEHVFKNVPTSPRAVPTTVSAKTATDTATTDTAVGGTSKTIADAMSSLKQGLISLGAEYPHLITPKYWKADENRISYRANCDWLGKRGWADTGSHALGLDVEIMPEDEFQKKVHTAEMQSPNHKWKHLKLVGWTRLHLGEDHPPGFAEKVKRLLDDKCIRAIDRLDEQAATPAPEAAPATGTSTSATADGAPEDQNAPAIALPGGVRVELLGLAANPSSEGGWWAADGAPLGNAPYEYKHRPMPKRPKITAYELAFGLTGLPSGKPKPTVRMTVEGSDATGTLVATDSSGRVIPGVRALAAWMPEDQKKTRVEVAVATGPWRDVFTFAVDSRSNGVRKGSSVDVDRPVKRGDDIVITWDISPEWLAVRAAEVVLEDDHGRIVRPNESTRVLLDGRYHCSATFSNKRLADFIDVHLRERGLSIARFDNVSLRRDERTTVKATAMIVDNPLGLDKALRSKLRQAGSVLRRVTGECESHYHDYGEMPEQVRELFADHRDPDKHGLDPFAPGQPLRIVVDPDRPDVVQAWSVGPDGDWDGGRQIDSNDPKLDGDLGHEMRMRRVQTKWLADGLMQYYLEGKRLAMRPVTMGPASKEAEENKPVFKPDGLAWGPEVNGLQLAAELSSGKICTLNKPIKVKFHVRNASGHAIRVSIPSYVSLRENSIIINDAKGRRLRGQSIEWLGIILVKEHTLRPGEQISSGSRPIAFVTPGEDPPRPKGVRYLVEAQPGHHTVRFRQHFRGDDDPRQWRGRLESGRIEFAVVEPGSKSGGDREVKAAAAAPDAPGLWGKPVDGVRAKLEVGPWKLGHAGVPSFVLEVENDRSVMPAQLRGLQGFAVEIDSHSYRLEMLPTEKLGDIPVGYDDAVKDNAIYVFSLRNQDEHLVLQRHAQRGKYLSSLESYRLIPAKALGEEPVAKEPATSLTPGSHLLRVGVPIIVGFSKYPIQGIDEKNRLKHAWTRPVSFKVSQKKIAAEGTQSHAEFERQHKAAESDWGRPVDGVQARLRPAKSTWKVGQTPKLVADFRNRGARKLVMPLYAKYSWEIQYDGRWYESQTLARIRAMYMVLDKGDHKNDISLRLEDHSKWRSKEGDKPLVFKPGKHRLLAAFRLREGKESIRVVSQPVEIEILPRAESEKQSKAAKPTWGKPVDGVRVRAAATKKTWRIGQGPMDKHYGNVPLVDVVVGVSDHKRFQKSGLDQRKLCHAPSAFALEIDGRRYDHGAFYTSLPVPLMHPFKMRLALDDCWDRDRPVNSYGLSERGTRLEWTPGKHTVRVLFTELGQDPPPASEPFEIEILPADEITLGPWSDPWSKAVRDIQISARANKTAWPENSTPVLRVRVRNQGKKKYGFHRRPQSFSVFIDGQRYYNRSVCPTWRMPFGPGDEYETLVPLNDLWWKKDGINFSTPLEPLAPGKHTIHVMLSDLDTFVNPKSPPIEIEVVADKPATGDEKTKWGRPVDGVQVRLRPDRKKWPVGKTITWKIDARNKGKQEWRFTPSAYEAMKIDVDGREFHLPHVRGRVRFYDLKPDGQVNGISFQVPLRWQLEDHPFKLPPGKHRVSMTFSLRSKGEGAERIEVTSNTVEIEILQRKKPVSQFFPREIMLPDAPKTARDIEAFSSLHSAMTMADVVRKCGLPDEDVGSGIHIFVYRLRDGSTVRIGTSNLKFLIYVRHVGESGTIEMLPRKNSAPEKATHEDPPAEGSKTIWPSEIVAQGDVDFKRIGREYKIDCDGPAREGKPALHLKQLRFREYLGHVLGSLGVTWPTSAAETWWVELTLVDADGKVVARGHRPMKYDGKSADRFPQLHSGLTFHLGPSKEVLSRARRYQIRFLHPEKTKPGPTSEPGAPSLDEVIDALIARNAKYGSAALLIEYKRTVNDFVEKGPRTEYNTLLTRDGAFREQARLKPDGEVLSTRINTGTQRAEVDAGRVYAASFDDLPEPAEHSIRFSAHNVGFNLETTIGRQIWGFDERQFDYWRTAAAAGNLRVMRRKVAGIECVLVGSPGGGTTALAPQYDWAPVQWVGTVTATGFRKYGDYWMPSKIESVHHGKGYGMGGPEFFTTRDTLAIDGVKTGEQAMQAAEGPDPFVLPEPKPGERITVPYQRWKDSFDERTLTGNYLPTGEHSFKWTVSLPVKDATIWEISRFWRDAKQTRAALPSSGEPGKIAGSRRPPMPFYDADDHKTIWAVYNDKQKRLEPVDGPGTPGRRTSEWGKTVEGLQARLSVDDSSGLPDCIVEAKINKGSLVGGHLRTMDFHVRLDGQPYYLQLIDDQRRRGRLLVGYGYDNTIKGNAFYRFRIQSEDGELVAQRYIQDGSSAVDVEAYRFVAVGPPEKRQIPASLMPGKHTIRVGLPIVIGFSGPARLSGGGGSMVDGSLSAYAWTQPVSFETAKPTDAKPKKPRTTTEGAFQLRNELDVGLSTPSGMLGLSTVYFGEKLGRVGAEVTLNRGPLPKKKWRVEVALLDEAGKVLAKDQQSVGNMSAVELPDHTQMIIGPFDLGPAKDVLPRAKRYRIKLLDAKEPAGLPSPTVGVPSFNDVFKGLADRNKKYGAVAFEIQCKRTVKFRNRTVQGPDYSTVLMSDQTCREQSRKKPDGKIVAIRIQNGTQRAERCLVEIPTSKTSKSAKVEKRVISFYSHNWKLDVEHILGPQIRRLPDGRGDLWARMWQDDRASRELRQQTKRPVGPLRITRRKVAGIDCVVISARGAHAMALAPRYDWAPIKYSNAMGDITATGFHKHGDYWMPSKIEILHHEEVLGGPTYFVRPHETLEITRVKTAVGATTRETSRFALPKPQIGDLVVVFGANWNSRLDTEPVERTTLIGAAGRRHRFGFGMGSRYGPSFEWSEKLSPKDETAWTISQFWRDPNRVRAALPEKDAGATLDGRPSPPIPFLDPDDVKNVIWAVFDAKEKRLKRVDPPGTDVGSRPEPAKTVEAG